MLPVNDSLYQFEWYQRLQAVRNPAVQGAGESGQADSGKPKPLPRVDLAALAPLEFSPETSQELRAEIGRLVERISADTLGLATAGPAPAASAAQMPR